MTSVSDEIPVYDPANKPVEIPDGKIHLFDLGGKRYYMDSQVLPNVAFAYLRDVRKHGSDVAMANLIYKAMGDRTMDALAEAEDMTPEQAAHIMDIVKDHVIGQIEPYLGK